MKKVIWNKLSVNEKEQVLLRPTLTNTATVEKTQAIIDRVRREGDDAVKEFTEHFDKVRLTHLQVTADEFANASQMIDISTQTALKRAAQQIRQFHTAQSLKPIVIETSPGVICEMQTRPLQKVGLYVPGGTATLPSTLLMLGI